MSNYIKKTITVEIKFWKNSYDAYIKVFKGRWFRKEIYKNNIGPIDDIFEALDFITHEMKNSKENWSRNKRI